MAYQALYRVWRPRQLADVVGQEHITKTLQNAMVQQKLSHAYLFTGPRGTGKTSAAKIVARAVNCEQAPVKDPCNECATCRSALDGTLSDVIEIDAASNTGVDNIRDIRDQVNYAPSQAAYKVYIIDEVHMLSTGAFNALLKTLEEPPKHVLFILATTEPHKLPLTIISRCQRFDFRRISKQAMIRRMKEIVDNENIVCDEEALKAIARAADGGMRDALSILDQAVSYSDERVTTEDVLAVTGAASEALLSTVIAALRQQKIDEAIMSVHELLAAGKDPVRFIEDLLYYLRDLLLYQTVPDLREILEHNTIDADFQALAEQLTKEWIYAVIDIVNDSLQEMKWTNHPAIFLEVAFVKICHLDVDKQSAIIHHDFFDRIERLEEKLARLSHLKDEQPSKAPAPPPQPRPATNIQTLLKRATKHELTALKNRWSEIMEELRREKISVHAWLKASKPVACTSDTFLLAFQHEFHCQMAAKDDIRQTVETIAAKVIGKPFSMVAILETEWQRVKASFVRKRKEETMSSQSENEEDPLIAEAKKRFGEELIEIVEKGDMSE